MSAHVIPFVCGCLVAAISQTVAAEAGDESGPAADAVRADGDSPQGKVRLLLLAPTRPLVIEAEITIGGRPFRVVREQFIDEVLEAADSDRDGKRTWREAIENPRLAFGRLGWRLRNASRRDQLIKSVDSNGNGLVERNEARLLIATAGDNPVFRLQELHKIRDDYDIDRLLDLNDDHVLSKSELAVIEDRLKSRDTNNNDWLESLELWFAGNANFGQFAIRRRIFARNPTPQLMPTDGPKVLHALGPAADVTAIKTQLECVYGKKYEVSQFQTATPQITVRVSLGERDQMGRGIEVIAPALGLKSRTATADAATSQAVELSLSGTKLRFAIGVVNRQPPDFDEMAKQEMALRDEDENAVLKEGELDAPANTALSQAYGRWDSNRDGRVTLAEIRADYKREHLVRWSQAAVTTATEFPTLFELVDVNGDRRLSLREMREARKRILVLDEDGDGAIEPQERHGAITIVFSRAQERYSTEIFQIGRAKKPIVRRNEAVAPKWFLRMDRNHDDDISPREFLGSSKIFDRIDRDGDGLIDRAEAEKAGGGA